MVLLTLFFIQIFNVDGMIDGIPHIENGPLTNIFEGYVPFANFKFGYVK